MSGKLPELRLAVRMAPLNGKLVPVLCCAETGRVLQGQVSADVSVSVDGMQGGVGFLRVSSEFLVSTESSSE